jgi:hypothetical protein
MDPRTLIRDGDKVKANLVTMEDGSIVTRKGCTLQIPLRFTERSLAIISSEIYVIGIWAMVVDQKYYGVSLTCAMMRISPSSTQVIKVDDDDYLEFGFAPGSVVFATNQLLKTNTIVYQIFDEFISNGRIPWYVAYEDLARVFDTAGLHAGLDLTSSHTLLEMFAASISRDKEDRTRYFRQVVQDRQEQYSQPPVFIAFRDVMYSATNTTAKLMGSFASDGLTSALVNPAQKSERIEELLRR